MSRTVLELADTLAPADLGTLLAHEATLRARATELGGAAGRTLADQLDVVVACLRDHMAGACPQIPYRTISVLAAGVAYMATNLDIIPDFLPRSGVLDDAMVMAIVCELASDGLDRYVTWKGIARTPALGASDVRRRR